MEGEIEYPAELSIKYARDHNKYELLGAIGSSDSDKEAIIYKAKYGDNMVLIKIFNMYRVEDIYHLTNELYIAKKCCNDENVQGVHCSFKVKNQLWVVMPFISMVSLKSIIMSSSYRHGLPEPAIAFVLKETLKALDCIHRHGDHVYDKVDANHLFLDDNLKVKLGFPSLTYKPPRAFEEILTSGDHTKTLDIWMVGILALELFYGSNTKDFEPLVRNIMNNSFHKKNKSPSFLGKLGGSCFNGNIKSKNLPKSLRELVVLCLSRDPLKRPTPIELLNHKFFERCSATDRRVQKVLKKLLLARTIENQGEAVPASK